MRSAWLMAAAVLAGSLAAAQSVSTGIEAWSRADYAGALNAWRPLAARGDADAMFNMGQAYRLGRGVPIDLAQAQEWYGRAARAGHLDAQVQLGMLLFQNGSQAAGLRWLKSAAAKGDPRAQLLYGTALYNGDGVARDPVAAYSFVARSAAQGLAPAQATLAQMDATVPVALRRKALAQVTIHAAAKPSPPAKPVPLPKQPPVTLALPSAPAPTGGWRVQLGAFGQRSAAEGLFRKLAAGPLAGKRLILVAVGATTRLQAGPYVSREAANAACAALKARGQACFAVAAR